MNIYYYQSPSGNFGDDLNQWLWPRVLPVSLKNCTHEWLVGIGTILDERLVALKGRKAIFGTGFRPSEWIPTIQSDWTIAWVRGPLTCEALSLPREYAHTDPAMLVARVWNSNVGRTGSVGFMPHYHTMKLIDCQQLARRAGVTLIDPSQTTEQAMTAIASVDRILTEAMHGAIVADALNVPWKRIKLTSWRRESAKVSDFKWSDWTESISLTAPTCETVPVLAGARRGGPMSSVLTKMRAIGSAKAVRAAAQSTGFTVSDRAVLHGILNRMQDTIGDWEHRNGRF